MKMLILIALCSLGLSASAEALHNQSYIETVIGYVHNSEGIVFQVFNGGCTARQDFVVDVQHIPGQALITLYRVKPDFCKAFFPYGTFVKFSYDEIGISNRESFQVLNPINPGFRY